jgi:MscS family membrane protein
MSFEIFSESYYGNSLGAWFVTLCIIVGSVFVARLLYWISGNVVRRVVSRTKTRLDDIIVDMIEEPVVFALAAAGIWYGLAYLALPAAADRWIGNVFQVLIVLSIGWLVTRLLDSLYREYVVPLAEKSETDLDDQLLPILRKGTRIIVWGLTIVIALNNAGYDVGALLAGLGIGGLALAMAAKDTVSNIFGGFTIFTDRPFTIRDRIKIAGYDGTIEEIGIRSTRLRTLDGRTVTIPNSKFADSPVENISSEPSRKVTLNLGLTYDTTPEKMAEATDTLKKIVADTPDTEEKVITGFNAFGDFAMNIILIYYISKGGDIVGTQHSVNTEILRQFNARGLEFAFPTQTLYTKAL